MKKIRVLVRRLSLEHGLAHAGDEVELADEQALRLIELGMAEWTAPEAAALKGTKETATLPKAEKR